MKQCLEALIFSGIYFHTGSCVMAGISACLQERTERHSLKQNEVLYCLLHAGARQNSLKKKQIPDSILPDSRHASSCIWKRKTIIRILKVWDWRMMRKPQKWPVLISVSDISVQWLSSQMNQMPRTELSRMYPNLFEHGMILYPRNLTMAIAEPAGCDSL